MQSISELCDELERRYKAALIVDNLISHEQMAYDSLLLKSAPRLIASARAGEKMAEALKWMYDAWKVGLESSDFGEVDTASQAAEEALSLWKAATEK